MNCSDKTTRSVPAMRCVRRHAAGRNSSPIGRPPSNNKPDKVPFSGHSDAAGAVGALRICSAHLGHLAGLLPEADAEHQHRVAARRDRRPVALQHRGLVAPGRRVHVVDRRWPSGAQRRRLHIAAACGKIEKTGLSTFQTDAADGGQASKDGAAARGGGGRRCGTARCCRENLPLNFQVLGLM